MRRLVWVSLAALAASGCTTTVAQIARPTPYADFLIGSYAERSRDPVAASERFAAALRASPQDSLLLEGAAESALLAGDVTASAQFGRQARKAGVQTPSGQLAMAALALREGRAGVAQTQLRGFDGAPVEQLSARLLEVWAMAENHKTSAALEQLGDIQSEPRSPWTAMQHYQRAMMLEHANRADEALAEYVAGDAVGGLRIAQIVLLHGQLLERQGKRGDALALYQSLIDDVDNPGVLAARARLERNEPPPKPLTPASGAAISLFALAVLVGQDPSSQEDLAPLSLAMALDPAFEGARIAFSDSMRGLKREDAVRRTLAGIPATSPYYETAQSQIAFSLRRDNRDDEAIAVLKASADATGGRTSRRALADLYRGLERYDDAAQLYAKLVADLSPPTAKDWRLLFAQGAALERLGRWPEAEAALQKALVVSPDQPEVLNYLGYQWVDSGQKVQEGLAILQRAVAQRPNEGYIIDSLGWAYFKLGQYGQSVELLERAVELTPGDVTLNDHLGDAYWRVNRRIEARFQWRRVLTLDATDAERAAAQKKVTDGLPPAQ